MKIKEQILEKNPAAISIFEDKMWWMVDKGMNHIDCLQAVHRILRDHSL